MLMFCNIQNIYKVWLWSLLIGWTVYLPVTHADEQVTRVQQSLHLAEYIGGDYASAVQNGTVISPAEYAEQQEFAQRLVDFSAKLAPQTLQDQAKALSAAINAQASAEKVAELATALQSNLKKHYPNAVKINIQPDLKAAKDIYAENCAACHGATGQGDGAAGKKMMPRPADFHAPERAFKSIFSYYNTITHGVTGTGMPAFGTKLDETARWSLAFYVMQFQLDPKNITDNKINIEILKNKNVDTLQKMIEITPITFSSRADYTGLAAYSSVVFQPEVLTQHNINQQLALDIATNQLKASLVAAENKNWDKAMSLALSAYLDGIEPIEPQLATRAPALKDRIETAMLAYRAGIQNKLENRVVEMLNNNEVKLQGSKY